MFLPVYHKPPSTIDYAKSILEVPNAIDKKVANELISHALDAQVSGWHRRGSKTPEICQASFYTCLVFPHNSVIYEILDPVWEAFCKSTDDSISFIEHYEIKSYSEGDQFSSHNDILASNDNSVKRKINLVIQLSEDSDYEGGDLIVGNYICARQFGTGIFFPADHVHKITPITKGTRFSLIGHSWGPL